jgi:dimethylhistidine N-methyltransferase
MPEDIDSPVPDPLAFFEDNAPAHEDFRAEVIAGLSATPKALPPKLFYDAKGAALFEEITRTPEYYVTRTELALLRSVAPDIAGRAGRDAFVVEPGSGASRKITTLLDALDRPVGYVAIDISRDQLVDSASRIAKAYPNLSVGAICADFLEPLALPDEVTGHDGGRLGFFPGSTIGNFSPAEAAEVLARFRDLVGSDGALLVGADLVKDRETLERAYNDEVGVTADFNRNLLHRMENELDAEVDPEGFEHWAFYNEHESRIEMHLRSLRRQDIVVDGQRFDFEAGETIHTENSHKFDNDGFAELAARGGFTVGASWTDDEGLFSLQYLVAE